MALAVAVAQEAQAVPVAPGLPRHLRGAGLLGARAWGKASRSGTDRPDALHPIRCRDTAESQAIGQDLT